MLLDKPVHGKETTEILSLTSSSIEVKWKQLSAVPANLSRFYGYIVSYKESKRINYTEVESRTHKSSNETFVADITDLSFNTQYDITVRPYREMNGERDVASAYQTLHAKTSCKAPEKPLILNLAVLDLGKPEIPNISVTYQNKIELIPNCEEVTNISLKYELTEDDHYSYAVLSLIENTYTIIPDIDGEYQIWITVTNNEGYSSDSEKHTISIKNVPPEEDLFNDITQKAFQSSKDNSLADVSVSEEQIVIKEDESVQAEECLYANSAINVVNFEGYVEKRMAQIETLSTEYDELPAPDMSRCLTAKRDENKDRNRFRKIYPYDETRVLLEGTANNNDEYINATYITEQYIFLHKAVVEFIKHMNTSHNCNRFTQNFASVCDPQPDPEIMSSLKQELKHILDLKETTGNQDKGGLTEENINKNRNLEVVPGIQKDCLYLSFAVHDSKIVTQMPLPHTMGDFWKLNCGPYWPEEIGSKKCYGEVEVELLAADKSSECITIRDFRLEIIKKKSFAPPEVMTIRHFQLQSWPDKHKLPPYRKHLFDLMDQLHRWEQRQKIRLKEWKILVHCIDGGIRSGLFCGASFMLDRMKAEQDVNVSLSVRSIRRTRPQFFNSIVEYQFLYQMAVERLTESSEYVNTV
ncbi:hypothetical protein LSH36_839g05111 [Paralvinella palmiformis]|uniref:Protein-tyrosine-phosphatase n=1 Tax=Paralvinella palmiformis TaxID=53620 RepID=A0AAD9IZZ2_9ANNE|nr:hypothetical protein LSH36_839g05111 [Paralvinella palmiformis]